MKYLENEDKTRLEALCWAHAESARRDVALILVALYTGCRASELLGLQWRDVDFDTGTLFIRTLKRGKNRELPLSKKLLELIRPMRLETGLIFNISYPRLTQVWHHWRPCRLPFHSLRHTFGIQLYARCKDVRVVAKCLGHRSLASTSIYLERNYSIAEMRKLMGIR